MSSSPPSDAPLRSFAVRPACALAALALLAFFVGAATAQFRDAGVDIELEHFGLGATFRPGEIVPMRLRLTNSPVGRLDEAVMAYVQWEVPNADGDVGEYGRLVTLTRGRPLPVWLYAPIPPNAFSDTVWAVRIFEVRDGQRRGEIGGRRIRPIDFNSSAVALNTSMIAVIGQRQMGLNQYSVMRDERSVSAHENTRIVFGIRPDHIPDRWEALRPYEAIVWGGAAPQELTSDTGLALREYVRNGGHLVIVLPEDANPWQFGGRAQTALDDLLPRREPHKLAAVSISELLPTLSKSRSAQTEFSMGVRIFREIRGDFNAIDSPYEPLIAMPDGRVIAVQRTFGHGRMTIVGLDVSQGRLAALGLPHADVFWNRILGRRMDSPSGSELQALQEERMLISRRGGFDREVGSGALIREQISMPTAAGVGLMLALLLFAVYWVLAGPGGFAVLKMYKQTHHAWVAFAGAAGLFTALAWGAVGLIRINEPRIEHVTFLDHIARPGGEIREEDPQYQRAVSWLSLYTPGYQRTRLTLESDRFRRNVLMPWTPPPPETVPRFPNVDRYRVNIADSPASYEIPSRQTTTLLHAHWLGGLDPQWGGMIRESVDAPIQVVLDGAGNERGLYGRLTHDFARSLTNVTVIWVRNLRVPNRQYQLIDGAERPWVPWLQSGSMPNLGYAWRVAQWEPQTPLDLSDRSFEATGAAILSRTIEERYVERYRRTGLPTGPLTREQRLDFMEMLSIFHQLTPPQYFKARPDDRDPDPVSFNRRLAHEVDLSPWFTRPALIVIGFLEGSEIPVPIEIGEAGRKPASVGVTVVRWVYPLPLIEDIAFRRRIDDDEWTE